MRPREARCRRKAVRDFNPRIPYGMRRYSVQDDHTVIRFQSTHPVWDATCSYFIWGVPCAFQSTHPVWDATKIREALAEGGSISIHASRMGCDGGGHGRNAHSTISIHASRMGCDPKPTNSQPKTSYFNPRIPYGMRLEDVDDCGAESGISIHASRMGCDVAVATPINHVVISIHASRMGCDFR